MAQVAKYILGLGACLAVVSLITALARPDLGANAFPLSGLAAAVVFTAGSLGMVLISIPVPPVQRVSSVLLAMLIRMSLPLGVGFLLEYGPASARFQGIFGLIVVHYLAALLIETPLTVRMVNQQAQTQSSEPALENG